MSQGGIASDANSVWTPSWLIISLDGNCIVVNPSNSDFTVCDDRRCKAYISIAGRASYLELARDSTAVSWASNCVDRRYLEHCGS